MNVHPISMPYFCAIKQNAKIQQPKTSVFAPLLPNSDEYDYMPLYTSPDRGSKLKKEYEQKMNSAFFKDGELHPALKNMLDNKKFVFEIKENKPEVLTLKQALLECIDGEKQLNVHLYHGTDSIQNAQNIVKTGFNPKYVRRTEFGPGFYFAHTEGDAREYGSTVVVAKCSGRAAQLTGDYYHKIVNGAVTGAIEDFAGLKSKGYPTQQIEYETALHIANEYVRTVLVEDLGYDASYGAGRGKSCIVVHNPKTISDIEIL